MGTSRLSGKREIDTNMSDALSGASGTYTTSRDHGNYTGKRYN